MINYNFPYGFYSSDANKPTVLAGSGPFQSMSEAITEILAEYSNINQKGTPPIGHEFGVIENGVFTKYIYKYGDFALGNVGAGIVPSGAAIAISSEIPDGETTFGNDSTALSTAGAYALALTIASSNSGITDVKVGSTSVVSGSTKVATIPVASSEALGTIKIGYTTSGKNYPVVLDNNNKAYVNVPWNNTTYTNATTSTAGLMSSADKLKLDGIPSSAAANQNAFSAVTIGSGLTASASTTTDTLTLAAGSNISLALNDKTITINATGGGGSGIPSDFIEVVEPGLYNVDVNFTAEPTIATSVITTGGSSEVVNSELELKVNRIIAVLGSLYSDAVGDGTFVIS